MEELRLKNRVVAETFGNPDFQRWTVVHGRHLIVAGMSMVRRGSVEVLRSDRILSLSLASLSCEKMNFCRGFYAKI
ncbi:hypothetical protein PanWU01x14_100610 [Parasponia andersonii]|uniref:Uncharacterized protein n=1 Tax=Parasponia andersonii TaxID=3476 RepID=A0A2P5D3P5_PARAD|nr:hypothetical protein PanWU01x14_100610 [Parasponia andersonii]